MKYSADVLERFWAKVDKSGDCWEWTATKSYGYGRIKVNGRMPLAHRISWELANGREIPAGLEVDHMCFNHGCVNPDHLRLLTRSENARIYPPGYVNRGRPTDHCPKGHDKRVTGRTKRGACIVCQRAASRDYMRRARAGVA